MSGTHLAVSGSGYRMGWEHGRRRRPAVRANVEAFLGAAVRSGWDPRHLFREAEAARAAVAPALLDELRGLAGGAGLPEEQILAFNLLHTRVIADDCTVMFAMGDATASGRVLFMKNSDKIGSDTMVGEHFYMNKEINVVLHLRPDDGPAVIGVAAAGSTGLKMGINARGVAAGANISRTRALATRRVSVTEMRALDRTQLVREGLGEATARAAAGAIAGRLMERPMATSGNLEFVDSREGWVIEGSYDRHAVEVVTEGVASRTNCFVVLHDENDAEDLSSQCRLTRTRQLLREQRGHITLESMIAFSQDHANGPGPNSICRHGAHFAEETSQSTLVVELDADTPERSRVAIALGKPCHAWRHPDGHVEVTPGSGAEAVSERFRTGETWKTYWTEAPYAPGAAAALKR
jgi:isopenicillin-N N-acyltransferase like protein